MVEQTTDGRQTDDHERPGGIGRSFAESTAGFEYEYSPAVETFSQRSRGEYIADMAMFGVINITGRIRPTTPLTWLTWGVIRATAIAMWLFTIGVGIAGGGIAYHLLKESWDDMKDRRD